MERERSVRGKCPPIPPQVVTVEKVKWTPCFPKQWQHLVMGNLDKEFHKLRVAFESLDRVVRNSERSAQFDKATIEKAALDVKQLVEKASKIAAAAKVTVDEEEATTRAGEQKLKTAVSEVIKRGKWARTRRGDAPPDTPSEDERDE